MAPSTPPNKQAMIGTQAQPWLALKTTKTFMASQILTSQLLYNKNNIFYCNMSIIAATSFLILAI